MTESIAWYREKWVWFLIAIPASSVLMGILTITLSIQGRDTLVKDNYYKDGLAINQEIAKDRLAEAYDLSAEVIFSDHGEFRVVLAANDRFIIPPIVKLQVIHPTLADRDLDLRLIPDGGKSFIGYIEAPIDGRRYLDLSDDESSWRLKGELWFPASRPITLTPSLPVQND